MPVTRKRKASSITGSTNKRSKVSKATSKDEMEEDGKESSGVLSNCVIAVHGNLLKNRSSFPKIIRENGGKYSINVNNKTTHLISTEEDCDISHSKVREAQTFKLFIVNEDWLTACIEKGTRVNEDKYLLTVKGAITSRSGRGKRGKKNIVSSTFNVNIEEEEEDYDIMNEEEEIEFQQERMAIQLELAEEHRNRICHLVDQQDFSDVVVMPKEEKPIYAHKFLLLTNPVFKEHIQKAQPGPKGHVTIRFPNVPHDLLILILQVVYTGQANPKPQQILPLLELCDQFAITEYGEWLETSLWTIENVCVILEEAREAHKEAEFKKYLKLLEKNAEKVMETTSFRSLSAQTLSIILDSNRLEIQEIVLFERLLEWADAKLPPHVEDEEEVAKNRKNQLEPLFEKIRFPLIDGQELYEIEKLEIVPHSILMEAYRLIARGATEEDSPKCILRGSGSAGGVKWLKPQWISQIKKWISEESKRKGKLGKVLFNSNKNVFQMFYYFLKN